VQHKEFQQEVNRHTECRLGKWYFGGQGAENDQHLGSFKNIDAAHKLVHGPGRAALEAGKNGDMKGMVKQWRSMEQASQDVVYCIDQLMSDVQTASK